MIAVFFSWIIKGYQRLISPLLPPACRFHPSCSQYAVEALRAHGALSGGAMATVRILRCNPLFQGGIDMVPAPRGETRAN